MNKLEIGVIFLAFSLFTSCKILCNGMLQKSSGSCLLILIPFIFTFYEELSSLRTSSQKNCFAFFLAKISNFKSDAMIESLLNTG